MVNFNLPHAWVYSCESKRIEIYDDVKNTIFLPAIAGAKVADIIYLSDPYAEDDYIFQELAVVSNDGRCMELFINATLEYNPLLSIDSLVEHGILSDNYEGIEQLSPSSFIQLRTLFRNSSKYNPK